MIKRCIYFIRDNRLCMDVLRVNKTYEEVKEEGMPNVLNILSEMNVPYCRVLDVSSISIDSRLRGLNQKKIILSNGASLKEYWDEKWNLLKEEYVYLPGLFDNIYLTNLSEEQVNIALSNDAFVDVFHNPSGKVSCARALASFKLLVQQNKIDYLYDLNKFCYWYLMNCVIADNRKYLE